MTHKDGWDKALVLGLLILCAALTIAVVEGIHLEMDADRAVNLNSQRAEEFLQAGKGSADSLKGAGDALKGVADAAKPVLTNAATFIASSDGEVRAKSQLLTEEITGLRRVNDVTQDGLTQLFDELNGNPRSKYCPPDSGVPGAERGFRMWATAPGEGGRVCNILGVIPQLSLTLGEINKGAQTANRILADVEALVQQKEWAEIAPEVLAMVKHWEATGANIEAITADIKKMADNAANPKKKSLWLNLLGFVVSRSITGLVQR